jgi:hypothetical protein
LRLGTDPYDPDDYPALVLGAGLLTALALGAAARRVRKRSAIRAGSRR